MFISVILWGILAAMVGLGIYILYDNRKSKKEDKDDLY